MTHARTHAFVLAPALVALVLELVTFTRAPLWRDETATWQFARLGWGDLVRATDHADRVLLPYYASMHVIDRITPGLVTLRVPSLFAGVAAVVFTALVARRLWSPAAGFAAGLAIALNGSVIRLAIEARPGILAIAGCAASTWALLRVLQEDRQGWSGWPLHAVLLAGACAMQPLALLVLPAHGVLVVADRSRVRSWLLAALPGTAVSAALLLTSFGDRDQVSWIPDPTPAKVAEIVVQVGGGRGGLLVAVGAAVLAVVSHRAREAGWWAALAMVVVPLGGLLIVSAVVQPVLVGRYLSATPVGFALLIAAGTHALRGVTSTPVRRTVLPLVIALSLLPGLAPPFRASRGDDFPRLVTALQAVVHRGDLVVIHQSRPASGFQAGLAAYSGDRELRHDLEVGLVAGTGPDSWRQVLSKRPLRTRSVPPWSTGGSLWYVALVAAGGDPLGWAELEQHGCRRSYQRRVDRAVIVRLSCPGPLTPRR